MHPQKLIILLFCIIGITSCKKNVETSFSDISITTKNNELVEINVPNANGNETVGSKINNTINQSIITALHLGEPDNITSESVEESITTFNNEYKTFAQDFPETSPTWEAQIDGEVVFQSPEIISIALTSYTFTGGAHGMMHISFKNFNAETGELIKNESLFTDYSGFKTIAKAAFNKNVEDKNTLFEPTQFTMPANIAYTDDGIVLLYNTYEIAPYSTGIIEFVIPFSEAKPYLAFNSL